MGSRGVAVVAAGTGINLALGVLYTWSIFKESIKESIVSKAENGFAWDLASINDPYALACLVFAFMMIVAGRTQDKFGPRVTAFTGGVLVSLGFLLISETTSYWLWLIGFGGLVGTGIAFGYASATPAALKWFPPAKSGLVAGIVVAGFGLASAYIAPLSTYMVKQHGLLHTMLFFGIAFFIVVSLLSLLLVPPPPEHQPAFQSRRSGDQTKRDAFPHVDETPSTLLKKPQFWYLWVLYFIGAGAGLMVIGSISGMARLSMGEQAFLAVAILAVGNASGRVIVGMLSDKFGRQRVLAGVFLFQALLMFAAVQATQSHSALLIVLVATMIGFNYGANLAIFPSFTKDLWGMPHFGVNYGLLFTSWGVGGFVMSKLSETLKASSGSYTLSFVVSGCLLLAGFVMALMFHDHKEKARAEIRKSV
jgi:nitrate/nitrite transporter NarK